MPRDLIFGVTIFEISVILIWAITEIVNLRTYRRDSTQFLMQTLEARKMSDELVDKRVEKLQEQIAKLAANQLATQNAVDILKNLPEWQKQVELQIDTLKADVEAKTKPNPQRRPSRWSTFKQEVESNA